MAMPIKYSPFSLLLSLLLLALVLSSGCTKNPEAPVVTSPSALPDFEDIAPDGSTTLSNLPGGQNNAIPINPLIPISNGNFVATLTSFGVRMTNQELQTLKKRVAIKPSGKWSRTVSQNADQAKAQPQVNDVKRLYVKVDRDQLEVLSFVLNTGVRNIAVRSASGSKASLPTDGVTWEDFAKWFFAQRGTNSDGIKPFDAVSPSQPK